MDNCWQGDIAQPTPHKDASTLCVKDGNSNAIYGNGARRAYGLVWHLLKAGVPIYWIINPNKTSVDDADLTIDASGCTGSIDAVRLVDQSVPASYCGLDELHPLQTPTPVLGKVPAACGAGVTPPGTFPISSSAALPTITYRGGPLIVDAKDAPLARDVMAWYFAAPGPTSGVYRNPQTGKWAIP